MFRPSLYKLPRSEFRELPTGEYLSERCVQPISVRKLSMTAMKREWRIEVAFVSNLRALIQCWGEVGARFNAQMFSD